MPRKSITLPAEFIFSSEYRVLYSDVNSANHLGADRVLPIAMETQLRFIKHLGYDSATAFEDAGLIMGYSEVQYLAEAKYGDELLVELAVDNLQEKSFELVYRISNLNRDCEMARVVTTLLFFDYQKTCVIPVPESFLERVGVASGAAQ
ncbi:1,4-dihydroxy-2-naphthoyl-CoA hydrolase [Halioglobus japonicus]|nr:1,4-dihydroxy-2-naphthoyl-CoA hydrolase [Halioglobus japonicus]